MGHDQGLSKSRGQPLFCLKSVIQWEDEEKTSRFVILISHKNGFLCLTSLMFSYNIKLRLIITLLQVIYRFAILLGGLMPVTLRELGKATGYSVVTVSQVVNSRLHLASYETKRQILAMVKKLGYRPNLVRRSLRSAHKHHRAGRRQHYLMHLPFEAHVPQKADAFFSPCHPKSLVRHRRTHSQICALRVIENRVLI